MASSLNPPDGRERRGSRDHPPICRAFKIPGVATGFGDLGMRLAPARCKGIPQWLVVSSGGEKSDTTVSFKTLGP